MFTHLQELSDLDGISGREETVREYILAELSTSPATYTYTVDPAGNLLVSVTGAARAVNKTVFAAHMDEVGLIVTGITDEGYLRFDTVGGIVDAVLFGRRVRVNGHPGVIGGKAIHQCKEEEEGKAPSPDKLLIDLGVTDKDEAAAIAAPGDMVTFDTAYGEMGPHRVCGKALDDRAGCALLLELVRDIPPYDLTLAFTTQEEVGLRGAGVAGFTLQPDYAVIVDATTAADIAGSSPDTEVCHQTGGAVVSFMDRRTLYPRDLYDRIMALAAARGIPAQPKSKVAGGNDAGAFQTAGAGTRVAAVSLPCRYIHSPCCVLHKEDVTATAALLAALAGELPQ
ncbi:MAG: M42 family peptidase [Clostridia bacterium]|nr:M42 family peptidase [Clostridia bacterium]